MSICGSCGNNSIVPGMGVFTGCLVCGVQPHDVKVEIKVEPNVGAPPEHVAREVHRVLTGDRGGSGSGGGAVLDVQHRPIDTRDVVITAADSDAATRPPPLNSEQVQLAIMEQLEEIKYALARIAHNTADHRDPPFRFNPKWPSE